MTMHSYRRGADFIARCLGLVLLLANFSVSSVAGAQTKTFIDYLEPTPITCPLSSDTWGVDGVLPRDLCNGIESAKGAGVPPDYYYWDGKILKASDGTYHLFMSTWSGSDGFNPGWFGSESYHAVSTQGVLGPYTRKGYIWDSGSHQGHNTTACELLDGSYAVVVSEVVPFTIYHSDSLDGPWTACPNPSGELIDTNGVNAGSDTHWDSNVSLLNRPDGRFQIVQRHGLIALSDTLCGPYLMQKPSWTYPSQNIPSIDSIYPRRTSVPDPAITNPTYDWEEDPTIWYSGGRYHVLYSGSGDRIGYELSSPDGINDWRDGGLAFDPRMYDKIFGYEGSATVNQWYKMERPGVVMDNGHVTHVTWSVADVDKDNQIPAGSNHGSKIIVVPFDGVAFDTDTGDEPVGTGGTGGTGGQAGSAATGGASAMGGATGGVMATGGTGGAMPSGGASGVAAGGATDAEGGGSGVAMGGASGIATGGSGVATGGANGAATGGAPSGVATGGANGAAAGGPGAVATTGGPAATGAPSGAGPVPGNTGASSADSSGGSVGGTASIMPSPSATTPGLGPSEPSNGTDSNGCACLFAGMRSGNTGGALSFGLLLVVAGARRRRRRSRGDCAR